MPSRDGDDDPTEPYPTPIQPPRDVKSLEDVTRNLHLDSGTAGLIERIADSDDSPFEVGRKLSIAFRKLPEVDRNVQSEVISRARRYASARWRGGRDALARQQRGRGLLGLTRSQRSEMDHGEEAERLLKAAQSVIKTGPRGGKIVGYAGGDQKRPIYQGDPNEADAQPAKGDEAPAAAAGKDADLEHIKSLLDAAFGPEDAKPDAALAAGKPTDAAPVGAKADVKAASDAHTAAKSHAKEAVKAAKTAGEKSEKIAASAKGVIDAHKTYQDAQAAHDKEPEGEGKKATGAALEAAKTAHGKAVAEHKKNTDPEDGAAPESAAPESAAPAAEAGAAAPEAAAPTPAAGAPPAKPEASPHTKAAVDAAHKEVDAAAAAGAGAATPEAKKAAKGRSKAAQATLGAAADAHAQNGAAAQALQQADAAHQQAQAPPGAPPAGAAAAGSPAAPGQPPQGAQPPAPGAPGAPPPKIDQEPLAPGQGPHEDDPPVRGDVAPPTDTQAKAAEHEDLRQQLGALHEKLKALEAHVSGELVPMFNALKADMRQAHKEPSKDLIDWLGLKLGAFVKFMATMVGHGAKKLVGLDKPEKGKPTKKSLAPVFDYLRAVDGRIGRQAANLDGDPLSKSARVQPDRVAPLAAAALEALPGAIGELVAAARAASANESARQADALMKALRPPELSPPPFPNRDPYPFVGTIDLPGKVRVLVETARGGVRSGVGADGQTWQVLMPDHYGEIEGTMGTDGEPIDVFVGDAIDAPYVYLIANQDPTTGLHDEDKVFFGFRSRAEAETCYAAAYDRSDLKMDVRRISVPEFLDWVHDKDRHRQRIEAGTVMAKSMVRDADELLRLVGQHARDRNAVPMSDVDALLKAARGDDDGDALSKAGGPYIGPRGGKYADPQHKASWQPGAGATASEHKDHHDSEAQRHGKLTQHHNREAVAARASGDATGSALHDAAADKHQVAAKQHARANVAWNPKSTHVPKDVHEANRKKASALAHTATASAEQASDAADKHGKLSKAGGPYLGPKGGKWADPQHTVAWQDKANENKAVRRHETANAYVDEHESAVAHHEKKMNESTGDAASDHGQALRAHHEAKQAWKAVSRTDGAKQGAARKLTEDARAKSEKAKVTEAKPAGGPSRLDKFAAKRKAHMAAHPEQHGLDEAPAKKSARTDPSQQTMTNDAAGYAKSLRYGVGQDDALLRFGRSVAEVTDPEIEPSTRAAPQIIDPRENTDMAAGMAAFVRHLNHGARR